MAEKTTKTEVLDPADYKIYVVGGGAEYIKLLYDYGFNGCGKIEDASIVLFTGGEDVTPAMYGESPLPRTHFNTIRDDREKDIYLECILREIPMIGICRGAQFLNVMNGGKLWQHVNNHCGSHLAKVTVPFADYEEGKTFTVTSTHHQMMRPTDKGTVLLAASKATEKHAFGEMKMGLEENSDVEVVFYDESKCLCVQPHPELHYATAELVDYFEDLINFYILPYADKKKG